MSYDSCVIIIREIEESKNVWQYHGCESLMSLSLPLILNISCRKPLNWQRKQQMLTRTGTTKRRSKTMNMPYSTFYTPWSVCYAEKWSQLPLHSHTLDEVHGDKAKESVRSKIKSYLERAESLKAHLKKERNKKNKKMVEGGSSKKGGGKKKWE